MNDNDTCGMLPHYLTKPVCKKKKKKKLITYWLYPKDLRGQEAVSQMYLCSDCQQNGKVLDSLLVWSSDVC